LRFSRINKLPIENAKRSRNKRALKGVFINNNKKRKKRFLHL